ncbi:MAG: hypothetical protein ACFB4I_12080 [Cyanophyceae cyanobacterium]
MLFTSQAMSRAPILQPGQSYTFRSYYELPYEPEDTLAELGYTLRRSHLNFPLANTELNRLADLKARLEESPPYIYYTINRK